MRKKVISLKRVQLSVDTKAAKHITTDNHYENSCMLGGTTWGTDRHILTFSPVKAATSTGP